jgi:WXG100 family type VII secretion target
VTPLVDHLGAEVLGLLSQLKTAAGDLGHAGGPAHLAGDPAALRAAADAWRRQVGELGGIKSRLSSQVQEAIDGSWQGQASDAFAAQWQAMGAQIEDLLASQARVADSLAQAAERCSAQNSQAVVLAHEISALVSTLESTGDPSALMGMAGRGWDLLRRKDVLLHQIQTSWSAYAATLTAINLLFQHLLQQARAIQPQQVVVPRWDFRPELAPRPGLGLGGELHLGASPTGQRSGAIGVMPTNPAADPNWIIAAIIAAALMAAQGLIAAGTFTRLFEALSGALPAGSNTFFARKEEARLSAEERKALEDRAAGLQYDPGHLNSAMRKLRQAEKYRGERNKQKRQSN